MIWWLRTRNAAAILAAVVGVPLMSALVGGQVVPTVDALRALPTPLAILVPFVATVTVTSGLQRAVEDVEGMATRRVHLWDVGLIAVALGIGLTLCLALAWWTSSSLLVTTGRNLVALTALALLLARRVGHTAATTTVAAYVIVCTLFGRQLDGSIALWAWPMRTDLAPLLTISLLTASALALAPWRRWSRVATVEP